MDYDLFCGGFFWGGPFYGNLFCGGPGKKCTTGAMFNPALHSSQTLKKGGFPTGVSHIFLHPVIRIDELIRDIVGPIDTYGEASTPNKKNAIVRNVFISFCRFLVVFFIFYLSTVYYLVTLHYFFLIWHGILCQMLI